MSMPGIYLAASILLAAADAPHSFTIVDYWQKKCDEGDSAACAKIESNRKAAEKLLQLNLLASEFRDSIKAADFMLDEKRPDLGKAYPLVINNYLESFASASVIPAEQYAINYCSQHFHNYWLNRKFWWPTDEKDRPDWATIYIYVVDHYHGICLNQPFEQGLLLLQ